MKIYYQPQKKIFFHTEPSLPSILFGKESYILFREKEPYKYSFDISVNGKTAGPVIGIIAARDKGGYQGNFPLFKKLQEVIRSKGGISFVFSLHDIGKERIEGLCFHEERNMWVSCSFPLPNFIYNRIPYHSLERTEEYSEFLQWADRKNIRYFNPHFFNKWEVYQSLSDNESLVPFLPSTSLLQDSDKLLEFLQAKKKIYVKPVLSSKGKGIRLVELCEDGRILCRSTKKIEKFARYDRLIMKYPEWFGAGQYICQEAIQCKTLDNHRYDLRVLVHYSGTDFIISGIGIRISDRQEVTTHVPQGGKILPFHHFHSDELVKKVENIARTCGNQLQSTFGLIGEFSMDLGIRKETGELVLFEINAKPMKFDENEIETRRLESLADTFFYFSRREPGKST